MIQSVTNAVRILACFDEQTPSLALADIAHRLGANKSTVHHTVRTLVDLGCLRQRSDGRYELGLRLLALGTVAMQQLDIVRLADGYLKHLRAVFHETVHLAVADGVEAVYVAKAESPHSIRMASWVGKRVPLHCTGVGKVLLAYSPVLQRCVFNRPLARHTLHTITDGNALRRELDAIRRNGYAVDREEFERGLVCVAVPVVAPGATVLGAISIAGPRYRMSLAARGRMVEELRRASTALAAELGDSGTLGTAPQASLTRKRCVGKTVYVKDVDNGWT